MYQQRAPLAPVTNPRKIHQQYKPYLSLGKSQINSGNSNTAHERSTTWSLYQGSGTSTE
jgi:hypothetical protein